MSTHYEGLLSILRQEVELYHDLLILLQREKQCMMDLSLDSIHACNNEKETLILKLKVLEESRIEQIREISAEQEIRQPVTLAQIIEIVPAGLRKSLESCRSNLISLLSSVREVVQINAILAERSIHYTRESLSFLNRLTYTMPVYLSSGQIGEGPKSGKLVCKKG